MYKTRIIPVLLLQDQHVIKTTQFKRPIYVGDAINALRIFNEKEVDELAIIDRKASIRGIPDYEFISHLVGECFMPLSYGGGIQNLTQVKQLFSLGVEKIILGTSAFTQPKLINQISKEYGTQSVVVSIDVRLNWLGKKRVYISNGKKNVHTEPLAYAKQVEAAGAGEIILHSIEREGTGMGYDLELISDLSKIINIPLVALGGAGSINDLSKAIQAGASAVAASSIFLFKGPHKAVLISYPDSSEIKNYHF